ALGARGGGPPRSEARGGRATSGAAVPRGERRRARRRSAAAGGPLARLRVRVSAMNARAAWKIRLAGAVAIVAITGASARADEGETATTAAPIDRATSPATAPG